MDDSAVAPHRVELDGEYDLTRKQEVAELLATLDPMAPVEVDLSRVTYLDSTVLHELASLRMRCRERPVTIVGANPNVRRILHLVQFDEIFTVLDSP